MRPLNRLVFAVLAVVAAACSASSESSTVYEQGKQYQLVHEPATPTSGKISVEEFFCFCCPHCYHFNSEIEEWRKHKAADVQFDFVPNSLGRPDGEVQSRVFYIAEALSIEDKIHLPMFQAIHDQHIPMGSLASARDLFQSVAGVKPDDFDQLSSSFVVDSDVRKSELEARNYGITSTPTIVIGGKYMVVGGAADTTKVMDFLIDKVRKERKTS